MFFICIYFNNYGAIEYLVLILFWLIDRYIYLFCHYSNLRHCKFYLNVHDYYIVNENQYYSPARRLLDNQQCYILEFTRWDSKSESQISTT